MPAKQKDFSIKAGETLAISLRNTTTTTEVKTNSRLCVETFANAGPPGYSMTSERIDGNGNRLGTFCPVQTQETFVPFTSDCFVLMLKFTSAYGPASSDPNKMYYVGKESLVKYSTAEPSTIPSLYTIAYNKSGGLLTFTFTSLGTTAYQVNVAKASHALGPTIGNRQDAYGFPFTTAQYELWAIGGVGGNGVVMEGTITVDGGLTGGEAVSC